MKRSNPHIRASDAGSKIRSLRQRAEEVSRQDTGAPTTAGPDEMRRLLHELEVHEIELEMQNEELRRSQAELEESRDHWRTLYEFAPVAYMTVNRDAVIVECNLRTAALLGMDRAALKGKPFGRFVAFESGAEYHFFLEGLTAGTRQNCELMLRLPDKTLSVVAIEADPAESGGQRSWRWAITDITRRKRAERELRESEQRLQSYVDNAGDAIYVLDLMSGQVLNANKRAGEMLGYSRKELLQLFAADIETTLSPAGIYAAHLRAVREAVQFEGLHRRKDGSTMPVEIRLTSLAPVQPNAILAIVRDITARKRNEAEREQETKNRESFLAFLGHELRNPMAAISSALEVLARCPQEQRKELECMVGRQLGLMRRLLDDLLDLNRIAHGRIELQKEFLELGTCLRNAADSARPAIAARSQELAIHVPPGQVRFVADRARLEQIAANLLGNASKYTQTGGRIELSGDREGSEIVLRCRDTGRGIEPEDMEMIFQPFVTGRPTGDSYGEASLGIGLALVRQLAELHGGSVSVHSEGPGRGSEFVVRLPWIQPAGFSESATVTQIARSGVRRSIVMVEDNPHVAATIKLLLELAGNEVFAFSDATSALARAPELSPDAVLLDIGLPGMDGYQLAAELRKHSGMRNAIFIAMSGFGKVEGRDANFECYFTKPVGGAELVAAIETHCERRARRDARVLLVEDHPDLGAVMAEFLRQQGLDVQVARTGREALELAPVFEPQLVLCDLNLPDIKGTEVTRALRSRAETRGAYIVILSAKTADELRACNRDAGKVGVDEFIAKPLTRENVAMLKAKIAQPEH